jgi:hypothetical protein
MIVLPRLSKLPLTYENKKYNIKREICIAVKYVIIERKLLAA